MIATAREDSTLRTVFEFAKVLFFVYCFLVSIKLMGSGFKASGEGLDRLLETASNPFIGLVMGIVVTSIIQSSSTTTTIIVGIVSARPEFIHAAIPMIMGANIGTTVTNTIVSFGYVGRKTEFERSFGASIVHDMFNIYATMLLFPLELYTGIIFRTATALEHLFEGMGGLKFTSPLNVIINPVAKPIEHLIGNHIVLIVVAFVILFMSMTGIVNNMKGIVMEKIERVLNDYLFKNALVSLAFGCLFTAIVQSSSITTSIIIPLVGAGVLTINQIFPYTLGANIGTTITAFLAALVAIENKDAAITIALCHLTFNIFGIVALYPLKALPIGTARMIAAFVSKSKKHFLTFLVIYILLHVVPIVFAKFH